LKENNEKIGKYYFLADNCYIEYSMNRAKLVAPVDEDKIKKVKPIIYNLYRLILFLNRKENP
jgi:hypothetical protein